MVPGWARAPQIGRGRFPPALLYWGGKALKLSTLVSSQSFHCWSTRWLRLYVSGIKDWSYLMKITGNCSYLNAWCEVCWQCTSHYKKKKMTTFIIKRKICRPQWHFALNLYMLNLSVQFNSHINPLISPSVYLTPDCNKKFTLSQAWIYLDTNVK